MAEWLRSSMVDLASPPGNEVVWIGAQLGDTPYVAVRAQTAFEAIRKVATALGVEPGQVEIRRA